MGTVKWTEDQQKVIELRKRNILVSAAAGSGKTAVLVERIIQMITDKVHPVDIDRLLIVTFTSAAAGEMRERIGAAIEARLRMEPDNDHLQKQMILIHSAQITTIHSFCLHVIRNHFNQIDLDPGFRMGDEAEIRLMKSDVLDQVVESAYQEDKKEFRFFADSYSTGKTDAAIEDMVLKLHSFSMSYPWPQLWISQTVKAFQAESLEEIMESSWMKELLQMIKPVVLDALEENQRAISITEEGNGPYMYQEALEKDRKWLLKLEACDTYKEYQKVFFEMDFVRLSGKKDPTVDVDKREEVKEMRNSIKEAIGQLKKQFFYQSPEDSFEDMKKVRTRMEALVDLTIRFSREFAAKKEEKNILDFNDLEHFALNILLDGEKKPTLVAVELSELYEEILVDEYQDSNLVQETLLNSISKEKFRQPNLFMVGDVKQSIYKFRLAKPELFIEKYESYSKEDGEYQRIDLHKNFRSRRQVIDGINSVFEKIMHRSLGDIEYDKDAALYLGADYKGEEGGPAGGKSEVLLIEGKDELAEEMSSRELEAQVIIKRIRELKEEGYLVWDKDHYRKADYGDMVILLRTISGWSDEFVRILTGEGIPAYADMQTGYFSAVEVKVILNLLLIIDNPLQDLPLTSVLTSAIGGFSHEELGVIRSEGRDRSLIQESAGESIRNNTMYDSLLAYGSQDEECGNNSQEETENVSEAEKALKDKEELKEKVKAFLKQLNEFREIAPYTDVYELIQIIYSRTKYYNYVSVLPGGAVRRANLDMLLQKAVDFQGTSYHGLFHFNRYIEKLHQYDIDFGEGSDDDSGSEAVRIMSIHKSKGLEFPIVFLAGMGKTFNQQDSRSRLVLHPDLGIGPDYIDVERRTKSPTLLKKVMQRKMVLENLGEELRVLYVAMTRAKEKLIMVGMGKDLEKKTEKWQRGGEMSFQRISSAGNYLDWVMPCAFRDMENFTIRQVNVEELTLHQIEEQISREEVKKQLLQWEVKKYLSQEVKEKINEIVSFSYPFSKEDIIKAKISISELKLREYREIEEPVEEYDSLAENFPERVMFSGDAYIPDFIQDKEEMTGTRRGTLYHRIMQCISFVEIAEREKLKEELTKIADSGRIDSEDLKKANLQKLLDFFHSDIGKQMILAEERNQLYREQPFVLGIPASRVYLESESEELVIVQGIIDAYFIEEDKVVLLDYKTDYVNRKEELIERYKIQIDYYEEALAQITGKEVKKRLIYSFGLGEVVEV